MPETAQGHQEARIIQVTFFLPNRLGTLRQAVARLEEGGVNLRAISVLDAADHAVVRIVAEDPARAVEVLTAEGYGHCTTELLGVALPKDGSVGVGRVLTLLFSAEVNVEYLYSFHQRVDGMPALALQVDSQTMAARVLDGQGLRLLGQTDL
jgi:hypothetical protein